MKEDMGSVSTYTLTGGPNVATTVVDVSKVGILDRLWTRIKPDSRRGDGSCQLIEEASFDMDIHHNQDGITSISATLPPVVETEVMMHRLGNSNKLVSNGNGTTGGGDYSSTSFSREGSIIYCRHGNEYKVCCGRDMDKAGAGDAASHCHTPRNEGIDSTARRKLIIASVLCLAFMIAEIIGGYVAHSLAIMTDAAHLLTDFAGFMISLFSLWMAERPRTKRMSFGWYRAEVLGALISVVLIWVVTGILFYIAIQRIVNKDYEVDAKIMLITAAVGVGVNLIIGFSLHGVGHGHSHGGGGGGGHGHSHGGASSNNGHGHSHGGAGGGHGHSHGGDDAGGESGQVATVGSSADGQNINVRAALIHVIGDFLQSVGVLIAAFVIYFRSDWAIIDPICTFFFSVLVMITTFAITKDAVLVLMEGLPHGVNFADVHREFSSVPGVILVHNLRIWSLSMDKIALAAHLVVKTGSDTREILREASNRIRKKYSFFEMTLQIEDFDEGMNDCTQCENPKT